MTVYIVDLEDLPTRYTCEWKTHVPSLLKSHFNDVVVIDGTNIAQSATPGMFLNFAATNIYKSSQVEKISTLFNDGRVKDGDYFLFTDAWHPGIINLKYMAGLLGVSITTGGLWHAGAYDPYDGLGQRVGDKDWIKHAELSMYYSYDHNFFATEFHIELFLKSRQVTDTGSIVRTGWPMEYMAMTLSNYTRKKRELILFPHRISMEKQTDIFRDLAKSLPQYEFIVCQDKELTKKEYHELLSESKMVFSASLQETLGISSCSEGPLLGAIPICPDRLSYTEIFKNHESLLYPSEWAYNWEMYLDNKQRLIDKINDVMKNYDSYIKVTNEYLENTHDMYFNADNMVDAIKKRITK